MPRCLLRKCAFLLLISALLCSIPCRAASGSVAGVLSAALSQLDYEEESTASGGYSKFGRWYGISWGAWCDMFVSWCASQGGVEKADFPRSAGCTEHVRYFSDLGLYRVSAARGGSYTPRQGDAIFFYNYLLYPKGGVVRHVGLVLWVQDGYVYTVEGNTHTARKDYPYYPVVADNIHRSLMTPDYVAVKRYALNDPEIHGYGLPNYADRTPLGFMGYLDLGKFGDLRPVFESLAREGILPATSDCTYSPRYGMTRGDFITSVAKLFGLEGYDPATPAFPDVPVGHSAYAAAMAARSAGILQGGPETLFRPDLYVSADSAQAILTRALAYTSRQNRTFTFTPGDYSYMLTPYTIRADLARALYTLLTEECAGPEPCLDQILLGEEETLWPALTLDNWTYVPLTSLQEAFPELREVTAAGEEPAQNPEDGTSDPAAQAAAPEGDALVTDGQTPAPEARIIIPDDSPEVFVLPTEEPNPDAPRPAEGTDPALSVLPGESAVPDSGAGSDPAAPDREPPALPEEGVIFVLEMEPEDEEGTQAPVTPAEQTAKESALSLPEEIGAVEPWKQGQLPVPSASGQAVRGSCTLTDGEQQQEVPSFLWEGVRYVKLVESMQVMRYVVYKDDASVMHLLPSRHYR